MKNLYRKSEAGLTVIVIIVIAVLFLGWLINIGQRECKNNRDCNSESYCGSDFSCHPFPSIQKTVVQYNFFVPSIIISIAIVIAAIIFNWSKIISKEETEKVVEEQAEKISVKAPEEVEEITEPYYKSNTSSNVKTP